MSDLNLNQIQLRLNELFVTYSERKLVFWFDPNREFEEDIDNEAIRLDNAIIKKITLNNQFLTKRFFELEDTKNNYLVYAPFDKLDSDDKNNHLLSLVRYSDLFNADRMAIIMEQLNIAPDLHSLMNEYSKFFAAKSRISSFEKFYDSSISTKEELELTIMATITKANTSQLFSIIQALFVEFSEKSQEMYSQLENYGLKNVFWDYIKKYYGYNSEEPTIQKLIICFYSNAFYGQMGYQELSSGLKEFEVIEQTTAIVSFMDGMMNDSRYIDAFNKLSVETFCLIDGKDLVDKHSIEELIEVDVFECVHQKFIEYLTNQLLSGDMTPAISGIPFEEIITKKLRAHFSGRYKHQYHALLFAQKILSFSYTSKNTFSKVVQDYEESAFKMDFNYRKFILSIDNFQMTSEIFELFQKIEKKYKGFLDEISTTWNELFDVKKNASILDFYDDFATNKMKTVVIISDALRYEVAKEIQEKIQNEKKYSTKMNTIMTVLPSVTEFGKAASLRGRKESLEYIDGNDVLVNGMSTKGTLAREKLLQAKNEHSVAVTYTDIIDKDNAKELRDVFNGKEIIYLYHDQIDKVGDHGDGKRVFNAVEESINEITTLLTRVSNGANVYRFIITSDHGFVYTRSKIEEFDKIDNPSIDASDRVERRFIISQNHYNEIGISSTRLGDILRNNDSRKIHFPTTSAIFKKAGGGQNYVHGGSSPQEMLVPVLEVTVGRGTSIKESVKVQMMTSNRKIIGLSKVLEFYQNDYINDLISKASFSIYFEDKNGQLITNVNTYYADSTSSVAAERFTNFTFDFINRSYENNEKVFLVIKNMDTEVEYDRIEFTIDNPFAGGFNFDI